MILTYPIANLKKEAPITSPYGVYRGTKKDGTDIIHRGVDIGVPSNSPIVSIADGEVVRSDMRDKNGYGNLIIVKHNDYGVIYYSVYAHLTKRGVNEGDEVKKGDIIGYSGGDQGKENGAGNSTGAHLHFEIRKEPDGDWVDPVNYLGAISFVEDKEEVIKDVFDDIKNKVDEIDIEEIKKSFKDKLKDPEFREKLAKKLNITPEELEERLEDKGFLPTMVAAGVEILKDKAPIIWKGALKVWGFMKDTWEGIKSSKTAGWFKDRWKEVEKERAVVAPTGMWEQEEKIKKIIKKIL